MVSGPRNSRVSCRGCPLVRTSPSRCQPVPCRIYVQNRDALQLSVLSYLYTYLYIYTHIIYIIYIYIYMYMYMYIYIYCTHIYSDARGQAWLNTGFPGGGGPSSAGPLPPAVLGNIVTQGGRQGSKLDSVIHLRYVTTGFKIRELQGRSTDVLHLWWKSPPPPKVCPQWSEIQNRGLFRLVIGPGVSGSPGVYPESGLCA